MQAAVNPVWLPVNASVLTEGATSSVTIDASEAMQFYRLEQR